MNKPLIFTGVLLLAAAPAMANEAPNGAISGYILQQEIEVGSADVDDSGFGLKGWAALGPNFFAAFEYQDIGGDIDTDQLRVGGGFFNAMANGQAIWVQVEYLDFEDTDGFGVHIGGHAMISQKVGLYGTLGFLDIEDDDSNFEDDGLEIMAGIEFGLVPGMSLFAEYRTFDGDIFTVNEVHGGLNFYF